MKKLARIRDRLARRRARSAERSAAAEAARREREADDRSLGAATHPPSPPFTGSGF